MKCANETVTIELKNGASLNLCRDRVAALRGTLVIRLHRARKLQFITRWDVGTDFLYL